MGILHSPTIFLIIGIVSLTVVHGQLSNQNEISKRLKTYAVHMGLVEAAEFDVKFREVQELARKACNENGGPTSYDNAIRGLEKFGNCVMSTLEDEIKPDPTADQLDTLINQYCPKVPPLNNCLDQFIHSINPCLDENGREIADVLSSFLTSFLNYICENEGEHIKTFLIDGGSDCITSHQEALSNCFALLEQRKPGDQNSTNLSAKLPSIGPSTADCESFVEFQHCTERELKKCNKPSISDIGKSVVDLMFDKSGCKELLKSVASPTTIINSLVVMATIITIFL